MRRIFTLLLLLLFLLPISERIQAGSSLEILETKSELIKIYPNPIITDAQVRINPDINLETSKVSIVFYNLIGKEIFKIAQVKEYEILINKDSFKSNGVFFYQLKDEASVLATGRLIVK